MKKVLAVILSIIMVFSLCACGDKEKAEKYCFNCGEGISKDVMYCEHCGTKVESTPASDNASENKTSSENKNDKPTNSNTSSKPSGSTKPNVTENKGELEFKTAANGFEVSGIGTYKGNKLIIPSTYKSKKVVAIGKEAFKECTWITSITIPDSVTSIGSNAFYDCENLKNVYINNLKAWCNIDFPNYFSNPLVYADNLYLNNKLLTNVVIPQGVKKIPIGAFSAKNIASITIPNSVPSIGEFAFVDCESLTSITIPNSVTSIGESAFSQCDSLKSITIPNSVKSMGRSAFWSCDSLASITLSNSITSIGEHTFTGCDSLTSIIIPNSVTSIGESAFSQCDSLKSITIPNSVTSIGESAFFYCTSLTSITIPSSVTAIGDYAFYQCTALNDIQFQGTRAQWSAITLGHIWNDGVPATEVHCSDGDIEY